MKTKILMTLGILALLLAMPISLADTLSTENVGISDGAITTSIIKLDPNGDDEYKLLFENVQGLVYNVPYITNEHGVFKYGNDNRDFVFKESILNFGAENVSEQMPTVGHLDYFVVTDMEDSYVFRYDNYDRIKSELKFKDMATGDTITVQLQEFNSVPGVSYVGTLAFMDYGYGLYVANSESSVPPLYIDGNGDGQFNGVEIRPNIKNGYIVPSALLDLGNHDESVGGTWSVSISDSGVGVWDNAGKTISGNKSTFTLTSVVEDVSREFTSVNVIKKNKNKIGIKLSSLKSSGSIKLFRGAKYFVHGFTDYGALYTFFSPKGSPTTMTIEYPVI